MIGELVRLQTEYRILKLEQERQRQLADEQDEIQRLKAQIASLRHDLRERRKPGKEALAPADARTGERTKA